MVSYVPFRGDTEIRLISMQHEIDVSVSLHVCIAFVEFALPSCPGLPPICAHVGGH